MERKNKGEEKTNIERKKRKIKYEAGVRVLPETGLAVTKAVKPWADS